MGLRFNCLNSKKLYLIGLVIFTVFSDFNNLAKQITVYNKSPYDIFVATYYGKSFSTQSLKRYSSIVPVISGGASQVDLPPIVWDITTNRLLLYSVYENLLLDLVTHEQQKLLRPLNIGKSPSDSFYISLDKGHLNAYSSIDWNLLNPISSRLGLLKKRVGDALWFNSARSKYKEEPYSSKSASVRVSNDISNDEKLFIDKRLTKVKIAIERLLSQKLNLDEVPRIAICASGGGYRAMIATLGSLLGAEQIGLLDAIVYISALSGSTWLVSQWLISGMSLSELKREIGEKINNKFISALFSYKSDFLKYLMQKYAYIQGLSSIDIYGSALATNLLKNSNFGKNPFDVYLNHQIISIENGNYPFPIYTAIVTKQPYEWIEFNPYEIGSDYLGGYIPSWSLGRRFFQGESEAFKSNSKTLFAPPLSLGYLMGIWGSALSVNLKEVWVSVLRDLVPINIMSSLEEKFPKTSGSEITKQLYKYTALPLNLPILRYLNLRSSIEQTFEESVIKGVRFLPAQVYNFTYGLLKFPRGQEKRLTLVDAGIDFNLPFPPLLKPERKIDLIIVLDASSGANIGDELKKTEEHFKARNISFPKINYSRVQTNICNVFEDDKPETPTVVYLPLIANPNYKSGFDPKDCLDSFCSTFNFVYTKDQLDLLSGLTEFNMIENKECIINAIKNVVEIKRKHKAEKLKEYAKLLLLQRQGKA